MSWKSAKQINPLMSYLTALRLKSRAGRQNPTASHILQPSYPGYEPRRAPVVGRSVGKTYARKGITHDNASLADPNEPSKYREMPILGDLYEVLSASAETRRLANILKRLVHGSASTFNQQTNVRLDNKYTVLDISELTGDLLPVGMFIALDFVWDKAKENRTVEKAIFIDECWRLIGSTGNRIAAEFVLKYSRLFAATAGRQYARHRI